MKIMEFFKKKHADNPASDQEVFSHRPFNDKGEDGLNTVSADYLKNLIPIGQQLGTSQSQNLEISSRLCPAGSVLFNQGQDLAQLIYLQKGTVYLEANNGSGMEVQEGTMKAFYPLANQGIQYFTAIAKTEVTIVSVKGGQPTKSADTPKGFNLKIPEPLTDNAFVRAFVNHAQTKQLAIPQLPEIALKLRKVIQQDIGISEIVKVINMDPSLAARLIQIVNSPMYRTVNPITSCLDAVNRLGLKTTSNLATALSMKNLVISNDRVIKKIILDTWLESIKVSSISYHLARICRTVDPDEALLVGLLHNVGALPIVIYADKSPKDCYELSDLELAVKNLAGSLGHLILESWQFPEHLRTIPLHSSDWFYSQGEKLNLTDIVILARYHLQLATKDSNAEPLPILSTLPAFQKIEHHALTPDMSLLVLQEAKEQIAETMNFFRA